jgi:hypothetical protein
MHGAVGVSIGGGSGGVIGGGPSRGVGDVPRLLMVMGGESAAWATERGADAPARRCRRARGADDGGGGRGAHHVAFSGRKGNLVLVSQAEPAEVTIARLG